MNKKTRIFLSVFVALLVIVLVMTFWPKGSSGPDLRIQGWGEGQKIERSDEEGPIDHIEVTIGSDSVTMRRASKERWTMEPPKGARADRYKVRQILDLFKEGLASVISSRVKGEELAAFGLDEGNKVLVKLFKGEELFLALEVGLVQKPEEGFGEGDTFVRVPGSERVYRITNKDLRRPFEQGIKGLRDRRVNDFESKEIIAITIENPKALAELDRHIVLESKEKEAPKEEGEGKEEKKPERDWFFVKPSGYRVGDIRSYLSSIASVYAQEYVDSLPEGLEIGKENLRIEVALEDGRKVTMRVSDVKDDSAYIEVEGIPGYAKVSKYTAESLAKKVADLRDKTLFSGLRKEDIQRVRIKTRESLVEIERSGDRFKAISPSGLPLGQEPVNSLLRDIETLQARDILEREKVGEATGLEAPSLVLTVISKDGGTRQMVVGAESQKEKGSFYASLSGSNELYLVAKWMVDKVRKGPKDLRNKVVFDFPPERIRRIEIKHGDETLVLERIEGEGNRFKATSPEVVEKLDEDRVRSLVNTLSGLQVKAFEEGKDLGSVGLSRNAKVKLEVLVTLDDQSSHVLRVSEQNVSGDPYAMTPTERDFIGQVFILNQYQVRNFDKRLSELR